MTPERLSAILSATAGISILVASLSQWWTNTYDGKMILRPWAKAVIVAAIVVQVVALILLAR